MNIYTRILPALAAAALASGSAFAGDLTAPTGKAPHTEPAPLDPCEKFWAWATLYKNDSNPYIQEFALTGRYQGQYGWADRDDRGGEDGYDHRRTRYGFKAKLFKNVDVKAEAFAELNAHDWYAGFTELYAAYKASDAFTFTLGKQKPKFTLDWSTSSREIITIERSILTSNLGMYYLTGASAAGKVGKWSYFAGVFNNDTGDGLYPADEEEFGDLDGGWSYIASLAYDVSSVIGTEKASLRLDYLHSDIEAAEDEYFKSYDNAVALSLALKQGQWGLISEFVYADRATPVANGDGDMWGFYIMPTYDVTKKLQLLARYTHAESDGDALSPQSRYERYRELGPTLANVRGDSYDALYLGLNYYLCGHKLKLTNGIEYATMDSNNAGGDFESWTFVSGIRLYW